MDDLILVAAVLLLGLSQLLQKIGAVRHLAGATGARQWIAALLSPELLAAILAIFVGTLLWLYVLYEMEVSRAFPFMSLGSVLVVLISRFFLGEPVSRGRWAGVVLITIGLVLVGNS